MKKTIAVLFGGCSSEHEVSLQSVYAVLTHLDKEKYELVPIGISRTGEWFWYRGDWLGIKENTWWQELEQLQPVCLSPDRRRRGLLVLEEVPERYRFMEIDAVFPVLHGRNGEDGTLQGLAELAGIPLIGCGTLASALCMDKHRAHLLVRQAGIAVPRSILLTGQEKAQCREKDQTKYASALQEKELTAAQISRRQRSAAGLSFSFAAQEQAGERSIGIEEKAAAELGFPLFVKPVRAGSSYGVSFVQEQSELGAAIEKALQYDREVLLEEAIEGFETGCAVMGDEQLTVGRIDEIELTQGFFDYQEKYHLITSKIHVPARIDAEMERKLQETAKMIYRCLGCSGFARVDMFLTAEGEIVFNEVNTIPGFTEHSRFPNMLKSAGWTMEEILEYLVENALAGRASRGNSAKG